MRFPYQPIEPGKLGPVVPVRIFGRRPILVDAFIDSGADLSLFDASVAEALGIDHQKGTKLRITMGDGDQITAYRYQLLVQFSRYTFKAPICFSTALGSGFNLLGRSGFFDKFRICFHEKQAFVSVNRI